jgi:CheY-like chemotaxis protein
MGAALPPRGARCLRRFCSSTTSRPSLSAFTRLLRYDSLKVEFPTIPEFIVETAPGGQTGLAAIRERGPYAVIVSDLRMPGMDGVRFLENAPSRWQARGSC